MRERLQIKYMPFIPKEDNPPYCSSGIEQFWSSFSSEVYDNGWQLCDKIQQKFW